MDLEANVTSGSALVPRGIGKQAKDYTVGESITLVISRHGGFQAYYDDMFLHPHDRLIEVEIKSVKAVKKQEFIDA